jgi:hypothetical protein
MSSRRKYNSKNLEAMTVAQLKDLLREKGLPVSGKKAELVSRLEMLNLSMTELKDMLKKRDLPTSGKKSELVARLVSKRSKSAGQKRKSTKGTKKATTQKRKRAVSPVRCTVGKNNKNYYFDPDTGKRVSKRVAEARGSEDCVSKTTKYVPAEEEIRYSRFQIDSGEVGEMVSQFRAQRLEKEELEKVQEAIASKIIDSQLNKLDIVLSQQPTNGEVLRTLTNMEEKVKALVPVVRDETKESVAEFVDNVEQLKNEFRQKQLQEQATEVDLDAIDGTIASSSALLATALDDDPATAEDFTKFIESIQDESVKQEVIQALAKDVLTEKEELDLSSIILETQEQYGKIYQTFFTVKDTLIKDKTQQTKDLLLSNVDRVFPDNFIDLTTQDENVNEEDVLDYTLYVARPLYNTSKNGVVFYLDRTIPVTARINSESNAVRERFNKTFLVDTTSRVANLYKQTRINPIVSGDYIVAYNNTPNGVFEIEKDSLEDLQPGFVFLYPQLLSPPEDFDRTLLSLGYKDVGYDELPMIVSE